MMTRLFSLIASVALLAGVSLVAGCSGGGPPKTVIKGRIHDNGKVLSVRLVGGQAIGSLNMMIWPKDPKNTGGPVNAGINSQDGTFTIAGSDGNGIVADEYRITIEWRDDSSGPDKLGDRFSEVNSKIVRKLPLPENAELILDVSKADLGLK